MTPLVLYKLGGYAALGVALWVGHVYISNRANTLRAQAIHKTYTDAALAASVTMFRKSERLHEVANTLQETQNEQLETSRRTIASLRERLRHRPERPTVTIMPSDTSPTQNCTGAGLYRGDGEFLAWYATEAARIAAALQRCEAQYEQVRQSR